MPFTGENFSSPMGSLRSSGAVSSSATEGMNCLPMRSPASPISAAISGVTANSKRCATRVIAAARAGAISPASARSAALRSVRGFMVLGGKPGSGFQFGGQARRNIGLVDGLPHRQRGAASRPLRHAHRAETGFALERRRHRARRDQGVEGILVGGEILLAFEPVERNLLMHEPIAARPEPGYAVKLDTPDIGQVGDRDR